MTLAPKTIGIFSPSSSIIADRFEQGCDILRQRGYTLVIHPQTYVGSESGNQPAGTPQEKVEAYRDLASMSEIDLIMASTGGNRSYFLLPDFLNGPNHKPLMGFSDTTTLLAAHYTKGIKGFFGPTVQTLSRMDAASVDLTFEILSGSRTKPITFETAKTLNAKHVTAPIFAATLSSLCVLAGTPFMPDLNGHILILEDVGDETSRFDRMLWQSLNVVKPAGVIFGEFADTKDTGRPYGESMDNILEKHANSLHCPVISNAPIGHNGQIFPIHQGQTVTFDATNRTLIF
ncbi:MAG TPA: LD-carboxypeptidase [Alphaproteobacteria bacterium]|nr:LD-carboxypeptidase [Alphaproteobacteria bacterium]